MGSRQVEKKLRGKENWFEWKFEISKIMEEDMDMIDVVEGLLKRPTDPSKTFILSNFLKTDKKARRLIKSSVEKEPLELISDCSTAKEMWSKLHDAYAQDKDPKAATKTLSDCRLPPSVEQARKVLESINGYRLGIEDQAIAIYENHVMNSERDPSLYYVPHPDVFRMDVLTCLNCGTSGKLKQICYTCYHCGRSGHLCPICIKKISWMEKVPNSDKELPMMAHEKICTM